MNFVIKEAAHKKLDLFLNFWWVKNPKLFSEKLLSVLYLAILSISVFVMINVKFSDFSLRDS